jgi:hypothetical protein
MENRHCGITNHSWFDIKREVYAFDFRSLSSLVKGNRLFFEFFAQKLSSIKRPHSDCISDRDEDSNRPKLSVCVRPLRLTGHFGNLGTSTHVQFLENNFGQFSQPSIAFQNNAPNEDNFAKLTRRNKPRGNYDLH